MDETRNILDAQGNIIGELSLPEGTPEEIWLEKLTPYLFSNPVPTVVQIIANKVGNATEWGVNLIVSIAIENVAMGITQANKTKEVSDYCSIVARYLREGSLYAALVEIETLIANGAPSDLAPFITDERLENTRSKIKAYLGI